MSYLLELDELITERNQLEDKNEEPVKPRSERVYSTLLDALMARSIRIYRDSYGAIQGVEVVNVLQCKNFAPVAVVNFHQLVPLVTVRSMHLYKLIARIDDQIGDGILERATISSDLQIKQAKLTLTAKLRSYDSLIKRKFGSQMAAILQQQHRCARFPLRCLLDCANTNFEQLSSKWNV